MENGELNNKFTIVRVDDKVANVSPNLILSKNFKSSTSVNIKLLKNKFRPMEVCIIYEKNPKKGTDNSYYMNKTNVKTGEALKFYLNSDETYQLYKGLKGFYEFANNQKSFPVGKEIYVKVNNEDELNLINKYLNDPLNFKKILDNINDLDNLSNMNVATNIKILKKIEQKISENLNNSDESFWQKLFLENKLLISQLFAVPYAFYTQKMNVGGKDENGEGGGIVDFAYKNNLDNISIIEIKTPCTNLFLNSKYRGKIHNLSADLIGGVNQLLWYKQTLIEDYSTILRHSNGKFKVINIKSILLIGSLNNLNDENKEQFENFRNELKDIKIVTFDELLKKIQIMLELLKK